MKTLRETYQELCNESASATNNPERKIRAPQYADNEGMKPKSKRNWQQELISAEDRLI